MFLLGLGSEHVFSLLLESKRREKMTGLGCRLFGMKKSHFYKGKQIEGRAKTWALVAVKYECVREQLHIERDDRRW